MFKLSMFRVAALLMAGATLLYSCSDRLEQSGNEDEPLRIRVSASTVDVTKASDISFSDGDEIGLTVVKWQDGVEQDLTGIRQENNVCFSCSSGEFAASAAAYFPDRKTPCTFFAYYPYMREGFCEDSNVLPVKVESDQSSIYGFRESDWMVAVEKEVMPSSEPVPLHFEHILSRINVQMVAGEGCLDEDLTDINIKLKSFKTVASWDVVKKEFSDVSIRSDISTYRERKEDGTLSTSAYAVVVPQTFRANESMIYFEVNNKTLAYKPAEEMEFESGKSYTLRVTISITNLGPSVSVTTRIEDWKDGGTTIGDAIEETPVVGVVTDVDGNNYNYVEINGLYWMAANLKTAHYADGTEIPYAQAGDAAWMAMTTPAYCYFENNAENKSTLGVLYNYYAVKGGTLCPEGWRMPSRAELSALVDEENGDVDPMTLISPAWEGEEGTNETGFSAMPSGLAMDHWYNTDCYLWSGTEESDQDGKVRYGYLYLAQWPWTDVHDPAVGMGVRCVKEK